MNQSQSSTLIDPFQGDSILSLLPRTFPDSNRTVKSNDLEAIHQFMTSMAFQNPEKHFEEARSVVAGGAEFLNTKESEANIKENKQPRENRPALARKRAKFSMKPDLSQPSTIVEPTFQIDKLQHATPEEYFAAYEKFENARKELKRQRGEDLNEPKVLTTIRQRRPELPRRKVSYKHHTYSSQSQNDTSFSQETLQDNIESQPTHGSQQESITPNCQSKEDEIPGSITKSENNVNKLFDELLSSNIADLDGNEVSSYLQDCLNIKPVVAGNLQLPNFNDIPRVNLSFSVKDLLKDQTMLHDPLALSDRLKEKTPRKQKKVIENPLSPLSSPTPPKSPFWAISTLGKFKSKSIEVESNDPFSSRDMDSFPATTSSASKDKENSVSASKDTLLEPMRNIDVDELDHNFEEMDEEANVTGSYVVTDLQTKGDMEANAEDMVPTAASITEENLNVDDIPTDNVHPHSVQENVEDEIENEVSSTSPEELQKDCFQSGFCYSNLSLANGQRDDNSTNDLDASRLVQVPDTVPEQQNEVHPMTTENKIKKTTRARKVDLRKGRQSLGDAGTSWKAGVRRSNRIKRRPLEYWRGERLLYGRVHNSLPTIIGVKYISPTKDGFKVESFVADKYKDLVESMALH